MNDSLNALLTARTLLATIEKQATEVLSSLETKVTLNELYVYISWIRSMGYRCGLMI
ncbi:hypothetical protein [Ligilactobacillus saerimneri]|uniref:hypothetical protein n=1 Tax=Ligilactobacillus saerimneri TaxID=228229 RepID=UPI0024B1A1EE|nr:hypothetical protein [Ligilactobacillus saerimneri]MDI9206575.1 hypothetical protein [Ligilactobacillus saerimneri]